MLARDHSPFVLASSTRIISLSKTLGEVSRTLCTVLKRAHQASLWKIMMTDVSGSGLRHLRSLHLDKNIYHLFSRNDLT